MTFAVDQQNPPAVDDPLQIAGQLGQLIFTSQRQGLGRILNLCRQRFRRDESDALPLTAIPDAALPRPADPKNARSHIRG